MIRMAGGGGGGEVYPPPCLIAICVPSREILSRESREKYRDPGNFPDLLIWPEFHQLRCNLGRKMVPFLSLSYRKFVSFSSNFHNMSFKLQSCFA